MINNNNYLNNSYPNNNYPNNNYPNNNYPNNNLYVLQYQIQQAIQGLRISDNIRFMLQRGWQIQQIQQQMQPQWVSNVMNNQQVLQFIQFHGYTWNQVQGWVNQEIQRQVSNIINTIMSQQTMNVITTTTTMMANVVTNMMMNTNTMMRQMRQQITTQNKLNNTQIQGNLPSIQTPQNAVNQLPSPQTSNNNINSVPENSINDQITGYLEEIKKYVEQVMPSLLNEKKFNEQSWTDFMDIQQKLGMVLVYFSNSKKENSDYLNYSKCIDDFFKYWEDITANEAVFKSFLDYVEETLSKLDNSQLVGLTQPTKRLKAPDLFKVKEHSPNNGKKTERSKLARRYNAFVAIGNTYEKQDISGLRKYLTQLYSWIQEEHELIKDNDTSAEEMNLFRNVCSYYANVTKYFLNLVSRDYNDILDLNNELFKLYHDKFKKIEEENNEDSSIKGYVARKLHWLKMNFDSSSPAMLMVAKQFEYYKTDSDGHITELQEQLLNSKGENLSNNLDINTNTNSGADKDKLPEVVRLVNTLNADIERISVSDLAQRATANQARETAAASLAKVRGMCEEKTKANKFNRIMQLPKSVEIRSNFFTWCGWVWYRIRRLFNGEASLAKNSLTNEAGQVIEDQLNNVLSDNNIKLLSLGFLSQYKINAVLQQNSKWLAGNVIGQYLTSAIRSYDVIRGCERKVLEAFYNIVPTVLTDASDPKSFNGVKYGLLNLVSNVLGVTVNQTIFEFLKETVSKYIKREDRTLDYLSTSEIAGSLRKLFENGNVCKKLQSEIGKLFVDKFETNLKNEFSEVRRKIVLEEDVTEDNTMVYQCNDYTISNKLFELNQKYIDNNINSVNCSATFSNIFKHDPDFNHRESFLSKVKFNLQGYGAGEQQYLNQLQESFLSNLSLEHESQCRQELDDIQTKKQAKKSVEQKKQKQQNKNDENNINNDIKFENNVFDDIGEEDKNENTIVIPKVTLNKIDINKFAQGGKKFYCSESPEILEENGENKEEAKLNNNYPNNNYPNYNEFELCKPGLIDDRDLNDDSNLDSGSAPAITTLGEQMPMGSDVRVNKLETPNLGSENDENKIFTNNLEDQSFD